VNALDGSSVALSPEPPQLRPEDTLTNEEAGHADGDGLPPRIVEDRIKKASNCAFDTSREALKKLKASGRPDSVIITMVRAS